MEDKAYDRQREAIDLDSGLTRLVVESEKIAAFVSGAFDVSGERHSAAAGVEWKITPLTRFTLNGYTGNGIQASDAVSVYLSRGLTDSLTVYGGLISAQNRNNPFVSTSFRYDSREWVVGSSLKLPQLSFMRVFSDASISLEGMTENRHFRSENSDQEIGFGARLGFSAKLGAKSAAENAKEELAKAIRKREELFAKVVSLKYKQNTNPNLSRKRSDEIDRLLTKYIYPLPELDRKIRELSDGRY